jgi:hypothetical protein
MSYLPRLHHQTPCGAGKESSSRVARRNADVWMLGAVETA